MSRYTITEYILRLSVAFPFLYVPVAAYLAPDDWIWFIPDFVARFVTKEFFLNTFGIVQILIGLGILVLQNPILPALAAIGALVGIIVINGSAFDITFRDVSILLAAIALIVLHTNKKTSSESLPLT